MLFVMSLIANLGSIVADNKKHPFYGGGPMISMAVVIFFLIGAINVPNVPILFLCLLTCVGAMVFKIMNRYGDAENYAKTTVESVAYFLWWIIIMYVIAEHAYETDVLHAGLLSKYLHSGYVCYVVAGAGTLLAMVLRSLLS